MYSKHNEAVNRHTDANVIHILFEGGNSVPGKEERHNKVLIIDESTLCRHMSKIMLSAQGCEVLESGSSDHGLRTIQTENPDLIILDATMPGNDAFETLEIIQTSEYSVNIPVIIMTSEDLYTDHQFDGLSAADDYIFKPFTADQLFKLTERYIEPEHPGKNQIQA